VPSVKENYKFAWSAHAACRNLIKNKSYHLAIREDLTPPVIVDVSAEEMIADHYLNLLDEMDDRSRGAVGDKDEEDKVYNMIKMIVAELDNLEETIETGKEKKHISKIRGLFRKLIRDFFQEYADKDEDEDEEAEVEPAATPAPEAEAMPTPTPTPAVSANRNVFAKRINLDEATKKEVIDDFGENICIAIRHRLPVIYEVSDDLQQIVISELENRKKSPILKIGINDHLHINSIVPVSKLYDMYPYHSLEFYQKFWKPIVEKVGHFFIEDAGILISPKHQRLPDIPKKCPESHMVKGWDCCKRNLVPVSVSFRGDKTPIWIFEASSNQLNKMAKKTSKYTEQKYINAVVKCIDPNLDSIYNKTGSVIQVMPATDHIELDVDFGRGLDVVRLTESQIEIVPLGE